MEVQHMAHRFDKTIFWRDTREVLAAVFALAYMGTQSVMSGDALAMSGGLFLSACVVYVLIRLLGVRWKQPRVAEDLPLVARLQAEIGKVQSQIELLRKVRSWYVAPLAIGSVVWIGTLAVNELPAVGTVFVVLGAIGLFALVGYFVEWLNRKAVRDELVPYREYLQQMLRDARDGAGAGT